MPRARDFLRATAPDGDAVLAGHSLGSIIGTAVAAGPDAPPLRGLILANPIAAAPNPRSLGTRAARWLHGVAARLPERAGTALLRHRLVTRIASQACWISWPPGCGFARVRSALVVAGDEGTPG
jgi:pimeloyl-ACP methyl ester carboxylesterase